jgi:hypothetical protein
MRKPFLLLLFILIGVSHSNTKNLTYLSCYSFYRYDLALGYQRIVRDKNAIGVLIECKSYQFNQLDILGAYINYNYFLKDNFKGLWLTTHLGVESYDGEIRVPLIPGVGYNWVTPVGISLGFNLGIGPLFKRTVKYDTHWRFLGIGHIGYAF